MLFVLVNLLMDWVSISINDQELVEIKEAKAIFKFHVVFKIQTIQKSDIVKDDHR